MQFIVAFQHIDVSWIGTCVLCGYVCIDESMMKLTSTYRRFTCFENRLTERWIHVTRIQPMRLHNFHCLTTHANSKTNYFCIFQITCQHRGDHRSNSCLCITEIDTFCVNCCWFIRAHCLPLNAFEFLHFFARPRYGRLNVSIEKQQKKIPLWSNRTLFVRCVCIEIEMSGTMSIYGLVLRRVWILVHIICIQHPQYIHT